MFWANSSWSAGQDARDVTLLLCMLCSCYINLSIKVSVHLMSVKHNMLGSAAGDKAIVAPDCLFVSCSAPVASKSLLAVALRSSGAMVLW